MAQSALWVHGNAVRPEWVGENLARVIGGRWDETAGEIPWSEVNGSPRGWGTTYRGRASHADGLAGDGGADDLKQYWFHFSLPTPVLDLDARAALSRVCVLWRGGPDVSPGVLHVYDGGRRIAEFALSPDESGRNGLGGEDDLVEGVTSFELSSPRPLLFGLGLSMGFRFRADADLTFFGAGAYFEDARSERR